jgi:RNA polymerase-associated protein
VKIALREKGVAFERVLPEDFGTGRRDIAFAIANPRTEVPVLLPAFCSKIHSHAPTRA